MLKTYLNSPSIACEFHHLDQNPTHLTFLQAPANTYKATSGLLFMYLKHTFFWKDSWSPTYITSRHIVWITSRHLDVFIIFEYGHVSWTSEIIRNQAWPIGVEDLIPNTGGTIGRHQLSPVLFPTHTFEFWKLIFPGQYTKCWRMMLDIAIGQQTEGNSKVWWLGEWKRIWIVDLSKMEEMKDLD